MSEDTMCITKRMHLVSMHAHAHEHTHMMCTYVSCTGRAFILEPKVMIRFGYLMELSAGPLMLRIEFSTNACSTPQPRDLHNSKPQRCSPHLVADPSPLILSGPAHRLVLGAIHDGCPIQDTSTHKTTSKEPLADLHERSYAHDHDLLPSGQPRAVSLLPTRVLTVRPVQSRRASALVSACTHKRNILR